MLSVNQQRKAETLTGIHEKVFYSISTKKWNSLKEIFADMRSRGQQIDPKSFERCLHDLKDQGLVKEMGSKGCYMFKREQAPVKKKVQAINRNTTTQPVAAPPKQRMTFDTLMEEMSKNVDEIKERLDRVVELTIHMSAIRDKDKERQQDLEALQNILSKLNT